MIIIDLICQGAVLWAAGITPLLIAFMLHLGIAAAIFARWCVEGVQGGRGGKGVLLLLLRWFPVCLACARLKGPCILGAVRAQLELCVYVRERRGGLSLTGGVRLGVYMLTSKVVERGGGE
jgi:hypothetical protein